MLDCAAFAFLAARAASLFSAFMSLPISPKTSCALSTVLRMTSVSVPFLCLSLASSATALLYLAPLWIAFASETVLIAFRRADSLSSEKSSALSSRTLSGVGAGWSGAPSQSGETVADIQTLRVVP